MVDSITFSNFVIYSFNNFTNLNIFLRLKTLFISLGNIFNRNSSSIFRSSIPSIFKFAKGTVTNKTCNNVLKRDNQTLTNQQNLHIPTISTIYQYRQHSIDEHLHAMNVEWGLGLYLHQKQIHHFPQQMRCHSLQGDFVPYFELEIILLP